jgi:hypothetical protein
MMGQERRNRPSRTVELWDVERDVAIGEALFASTAWALRSRPRTAAAGGRPKAGLEGGREKSHARLTSTTMMEPDASSTLIHHPHPRSAASLLGWPPARAPRRPGRRRRRLPEARPQLRGENDASARGSERQHRSGDSNSTSPVSSIRWRDLRFQRTSGDRSCRCCPWFTRRLRTQHGPTRGSGPVRSRTPLGAPVLRDQGLDRPAGHGKADACRCQGRMTGASRPSWLFSCSSHSIDTFDLVLTLEESRVRSLCRNRSR